MAPKLFVPNFDFEHALAAPATYRPSATVKRLGEELATVWVAVANDDDFLWMPTPAEVGFFDHLAANGLPRLRPVARATDVTEAVEVCPWGWTEEVRRWAKRPGWSCVAPRQTAVRQANSRRTAFELECEWGIGLPGAAMIRSPAELLAVLAGLSPTQPWVIKAELGMSARERLLGRGPHPSTANVNWVRKRLARDGTVFFEPWVERLNEVSVHFTIPPSGPPVFDGATPLWTDASGHYCGNEFTATDSLQSWWQPAIETGQRAAERLQSLEYFGPLGIDVMQYRDDAGTPKLRMLQDVNARCTMGRLALGFRRLLQPGETGLWLHRRWRGPGISPEATLEQLQRDLPPGARIIRTSPFEVGGRPTVHGTIVCCMRGGKPVNPST